MTVLITEETCLCDSCGKEKPKRLVQRSRETGKLRCTACRERARREDLSLQETCASCGEFALIVRRKDDRTGDCQGCYQSGRGQIEETCGRCNRLRIIVMRKPDGTGWCRACRTSEWRQSNRSAWNRSRQKYRDRNRDDPHNVRRSGQEWTTEEMDLITAPDRPSDRRLSSRLGRTISAIQIKRSKHKATV